MPVGQSGPTTRASAELAVSIDEDWISATLIVSVDTCDERLAVDPLLADTDADAFIGSDPGCRCRYCYRR